MKNTKRAVTYKIIAGYILVVILAVAAFWVIYAQVRNYTSLTEIKNENNEKLFLVGKAITGLYEAESLTRNIIQTSNTENYTSYQAKVDTILATIQKVMKITDDSLQVKKIDSITTLIDSKNKNFKELIAIYRQRKDKNLQQNIIEELQKNSNDYGNYQNYEDRFKNLSEGGKKYLKTLLEWSKEDNQQRLSNETLDSVAKRFYKAVAEIEQKERNYDQQIKIRENNLLKNDQTITKQLRAILSSIEENERKAYLNRLEASNTILNKTSTYILIIGATSFVIALLFIYLITKDVSQSQKYRVALEKEKSYTESLLKTRESLINTVTHDLRSPLNTVIGYSDLLDRTTLNQKQKYYLEHLKKSSDYILHLVNDLLDLSKLEAGKMSVEELPFSPKKIIEDTVDSVIPINDQKNIRIKLLVSEELNKQFISDPFRIKQVLTNLLNNAYKFTEQGSIVIKAGLKENGIGDKKLVIAVSDTGIGISKNQQQLIFEEFSQGDQSTEQRIGGFGLGLAITKKIVTLLNGTISLTSKLDEGSTFTISIPVQTHSLAADPLKNAKNQYDQIIEDKKLLIVDDDPSQIALTSEIIAQTGLAYDTCHNGKEAITLLNQHHYDLILTDIQMPSMDGFELIEKAKNITNSPFIALSGKTNATNDFYKQAGFLGSLRKPYTPTELLTLIREVLQVSIPQPNININEVKETTVDFHLEDIKQFAQGDPDSFYTILDAFYEGTKNNIKQLKEIVANKDLVALKRVTHKMLPMFRQIKAHTIINLLTKLEHPNQYDITEDIIFDLANEAIEKIEVLIEKLKVE
ncbi:hybrid sensor histidine kinase/response regulator [Aquimarina brevivitae]|uniref:histidine kinase n=1 Tax=Aquimarina brevivitae TaxID=323412 RepID=A0A4Q7PIG3_9FLAO|nr:ATP-binding protein [Aquimarina brevivitae]RZS99600.1 hypothetical protein EV197_0822 [Aquimarina brevivitae]